MHKTITADLAAPSERVALVLRDLSCYPEWLEIVARAEPTSETEGDAGPGWTITLRATVGPLARSKRLRMVRTIDSPTHIRFQRHEVDGRDHADWLLDVHMTGTTTCRVTVELRYDGGFWSAPLEAILGSQVDDAVPRLRALVSS